MKNSSMILAAGAVAAMASTAAFGARIESATSDLGIKSATTSNVVLPGSFRDGITYDFDVAGIVSNAGRGDAGNTVVNLDLAAALGFASGTSVTMNGVGWNVNITGNDPSWLSEVAVNFDDSAQSTLGIDLAPGAGVDAPGINQNFDSLGTVKLADVAIPDLVLPDGILRMEFFEGFDDPEVAPDGGWDSGFLTIQAVPTPGAAAILGLGGVAAFRRRR